jgi:hypothetical protein
MKAGRRQMRMRRAIELILHPGEQRVERRRIRARHVRRRHQPRARLAHHDFRDVAVLAQLRQIELIKQEICGLRALVVAGDTVLVDERASCRRIWNWRRHGRGGRLRSRLRRRRGRGRRGRRRLAGHP